jgi:hypothetical protein
MTTLTTSTTPAETPAPPPVPEKAAAQPGFRRYRRVIVLALLIGIRIDPQATFTPENTYFRDDRVKQVVGVKLQLKAGIGYAKPGMPSDGEILVQGDNWPSQRKQ